MKHCIVCGAPISDNNPDGIGYTCRKLVDAKLASAAFKLHSDNMSQFWNIDIPLLIEKVSFLLEQHTGRKAYRNEFKKSFYPSVLNQMQTKGFLSKKQRDILLKTISFECPEWWGFYETTVRKTKADLINKWKSEVTKSDEYNRIIEGCRKKAVEKKSMISRNGANNAVT